MNLMQADKMIKILKKMKSEINSGWCSAGIASSAPRWDMLNNKESEYNVIAHHSEECNKAFKELMRLYDLLMEEQF